MCDWIGNLPPSVHALVLLAVVNVGLCTAFVVLLLQAPRNGQINELIAPLGGAAVLVSAIWAFGLLLWGLWIEEVYTLSASLGVGCFASLLPILLVPWECLSSSCAEYDEASSWPRFGLALGVLACQVGLAILGLKPVWSAFCWRSLKRFGCDREAAALRRAALRAWAAQKIDLFCFLLQIPTVVYLPSFYDRAVADVRASVNTSEAAEVDVSNQFADRMDTLNNVFQWQSLIALAVVLQLGISLCTFVATRCQGVSARRSLSLALCALLVVAGLLAASSLVSLITYVLYLDYAHGSGSVSAALDSLDFPAPSAAASACLVVVMSTATLGRLLLIAVLMGFQKFLL